MSTYKVLNDDDEVINTIIADDEFMTANFSNYEKVVAPDPTDEELQQAARVWRDQELKSTDYIVPLSDHPQRAAYMTYRAALRDWPDTDEFPETRPNNPDYVPPE
ncbi:MAG: hypothetical protein CBD78_00065 [Candidatus Thioglobus sp. TMED218]|nr:MAG: hypothetical protein CBD78_00065 [Candidatus Thioglobus sp. TMED218]|tara:strand:- start:1808 stop:2122 length:315 start_codon:yes stop_codon:yes gene_type:complete